MLVLKRYFLIVATFALLSLVACDDDSVLLPDEQADAPPFNSSVYVGSDIISSDDPSTFRTITDKGRGERIVIDRRAGTWITIDAYLFDIEFGDSLTSEVQVNPEFGNPSLARTEAIKYGSILGQLPYCLREDVDALWIHRGFEAFGSGNRNLLIHTDEADKYASVGLLEEALLHEAVHTSLDAHHSLDSSWLAAQQSDGQFISSLARNYPLREDLAESFLVYFAVEYQEPRIPGYLGTLIRNIMPNRLEYLKGQELNMLPYE